MDSKHLVHLLALQHASNGNVEQKIMDLMPEARQEINIKSEAQIETETAYKWTARACAAFEKAQQSQIIEEKYHLIDWGDDLYHEALEHASLVKDKGMLVGKVQNIIESYKAKI